MIDKLMAARTRLLVINPFYGRVVMECDFIPSEMAWTEEEKRSMGIRLHDNRAEILFYRPWVDKSTLRDIYVRLMHCVEHLLRLHIVRGRDLNQKIWGIATDMSVNGKKSDPHIAYVRDGKTYLPPETIYCPHEWDDKDPAEVYYERLLKEMPPDPSQEQGQGGGQGQGKGKGKGKNQQQGGGGGQGQGQGQNQQQGDDDQNQNQGNNKKDKPSGQDLNSDTMDDHSTWHQSNTSEDEARQLVRSVVNNVKEKGIGDVPGHLVEILKQLDKPIVHWTELFKQWKARHVGNKRLTYSRANRRNEAFGVKGISHRAACSANIIVDTSGSIGTAELEKFFAEIDAMSSSTKIFVLQWDAGFQGYTPYRKGDWKTFKIGGRGGTDIAAPVQWLEENKVLREVMVMFTDGQVFGWADERPWPMVTVITDKKNVNAGAKNSKKDGGPNWGYTLFLNE